MKYIIFFLFISNLYSCQEKKISSIDKCEQLRLKASLCLNKGLSDAQNSKLDSAIYYSELAYQCDSTNVGILETRLSAYSQNRMYKEALKTINKLSSINKLDSSKEAYSFLKVGYFMALDEKGYQDSIKSYYNYVSKKFDEHKDEKNFRSKYPVYFEPKVLLEYYFNGKESALAILNKFPSEYKLDELNDLIRITNTPPKNMILNYLYIKDTIR
uniref:hypothetical protein n=1 Tax=Ornithobacterium rhinotracheale TaxID=28251 RepID=UPI00129CD648|nr:hypothetical protein [Ornithobacterium rhinotracheale]